MPFDFRDDRRPLREIFRDYGWRTYGDVFKVWPTFVQDQEARIAAHFAGIVADWERDNPPESRPALAQDPNRDWHKPVTPRGVAPLDPNRDWHTMPTAPRGLTDGP